jgi:hypothetical protein
MYIIVRASGQLLNVLVEEQRLANVLNLWDRALQVEGFGQYNFEDLG